MCGLTFENVNGCAQNLSCFNDTFMLYIDCCEAFESSLYWQIIVMFYKLSSCISTKKISKEHRIYGDFWNILLVVVEIIIFLLKYRNG